MKKFLLPLLCAAAILPLACSTTPQSDATLFQGKWQGKENGRPGNCVLSVSGNTLEFRGADARDWYKGTFILREDTTPKQLIATVSDCAAPEFIGRKSYAIYRIDRGTRTITGHHPGFEEVPASFNAPGARSFTLEKF